MVTFTALPPARLFTPPIGVYDDMAYNAVVVLLFKAAILERNVRHRHDLSENIVIDV